MKSLPEFVREAFDEVSSDRAPRGDVPSSDRSSNRGVSSDVSEPEVGEPEMTELLARLAEGLPTPRVSSAGWARLDASTSSVSGRYLPFYDDLITLFGCDEAHLRRELARAEDPRSWSWTPLSGVRFFQVERGLARPRGDCLLVRLDASARLPRHSHAGREESLVLEGGYRDEEGALFHAGDFHVSEGGSKHELHVLPDGPCVTAVFLEERFVFDALWPRTLLRLFWARR